MTNVFSKLNKMEIQTGALLKAAAVTMNSTFKRALGQTLFKVFWEESPGIKIFCRPLTTCSATLNNILQ